MRWPFITEAITDAVGKDQEEHGDALRDLLELEEKLRHVTVGQEAHLLLERPADMSAEEWKHRLKASVSEAIRFRWSADPTTAQYETVTISYFHNTDRARIELRHLDDRRKVSKETSDSKINLLDVSEDEDTVNAVIAVAEGLDALFRRLGPPPPHLRSEHEPLLHGGGGATE